MTTTYPLMYERPGVIRAADIAHFAEAYANGVRLMHVDGTPSEDIYHPSLRAWVAPDNFDYTAQETSWRELLAACPEAKLCLRLYIAPPPWWDEANPHELQRYADGRAEHAYLHTERRTLPSLASQLWRREAVAALKRFLHWLDSSGLAAHVWGIFPCYGVTWEWGILGSDDFIDYSAPMRAFFKSYLKEQYVNEAALRAAWGDAAVTFDAAAIPRPEARRLGENGLRVFPRDRAAYDFQRCLSRANADYLIDLLKCVRECCGDRYKLGTFYGYTLTAREGIGFSTKAGAAGLQGGHHALQRVLDSGLLDFLGSPYTYVNRDLGEGVLYTHFPMASAVAHGLGGYEENDLWTFTNQPDIVPPISIGITTTREDSVLHQRLALATALTRGTSYWWSDLTHSVRVARDLSNYSDPELRDELARHYAIFQKLTTEGHRPSAAQIVLIVDERAKDALSLDSTLFLDEVYKQLPQWAWCGAPFDCLLATDVTAATIANYKLAYVFAPYLSAVSRETLRNTLCRDGRTVWWGPYSGAMTDAGMDKAAAAALTGFESAQAAASPLPARRDFESWVSLHGPCTGLDSRQLAAIAAAAGVKLYGPAPLQVFAAEGLVSIHVLEAITIALPFFNEGEWHELFSDEDVIGDIYSFAAKDVRLFMKT